MDVLPPGTVLGGCRIEAVVGRGGMGLVYRARQLDLDRDVALKVIAPELLEDPAARKRFVSEARAAGAVEHPNVVPVHGAGVSEGRAYLVMRYIAGDDLRTLVRRDGPLDPDLAAAIAAQLGDALDAIHRAGYVHRDVKPQNVLLDADGHLYLSDFGLAKHVLSTSGPTRSEQWVGTLDYVAPEQIRGGPVDARADVYSLGGVLYFMLTGRVPFERGADHAKLWAHLHDDPPLPSEARPELPAEFDAVVQRALAKDPAARQPSAGDLARAARVAARGGADRGPETVVARGDAAPATTVMARPGRRRPRFALAAALASAGALGVLAILLWPDHNPPATQGARTTATARPSPAPTPGGPRVGAVFRRVGFRPRDLTVADGDVWVISNSRARMARIDARSGRRAGEQPLIGAGAANVASDRHTVWVAVPSRRAVVGLDARSGHVMRHIDTSLRPVRLAAGASGLWVVGRTRAPGDPDYLLRYDRSGALLQGQQPFANGIRAIALGGGSLWLALERRSRILRLRPGAAAEHGGWLRHPAAELAFGAGRLWASIPEDDAIARVHPRTGQVLTRAVARAPSQLAVAHHRVFVASNTTDKVVVLDPRTVRRAGSPLPVPPNPLGVAAGAGHVWVTGVGTNTLTRLDY